MALSLFSLLHQLQKNDTILSYCLAEFLVPFQVSLLVIYVATRRSFSSLRA